MLERLQARWRALNTRQRVHLVGVVLCTIAAVVHQATVWNWYIEDAAISFAYAEHVADGHGLVPVIGGERIEGYSNPTWVALLALFELFGISAWWSASLLALVLAAATVPLTYATTRFAVARDDSDAPLLAAGFLAMNAQFAIWGGSGLENPLFNLVLVLALWRTFAEAEAGLHGEEVFPWAAVAWFTLAVTRPEALAYAALGGGFSMLCALADGRGLRPTLRWLGVFWIPFLAYHALRFDYFAWEQPQTFYAKMGDHRPPRPWNWTGAGWNYVKNWGNATGNGLLLPVYGLGLVGPRADRALGALALCFTWAFAAMAITDHRLLLPTVLVFTYLLYVALIHTQEGAPRPRQVLLGLVPVAAFIGAAEYMRANGARTRIPDPDWLVHVPPALALLVAVGLPLLAWGGRNARNRVLLWAVLVAGLTYAVSVHGDWMRSWRWMSLVAVPGAILLGVGAESIAQMAQDVLVERPRRTPIAYTALGLLLLAPLPANVIGTHDFLQRPETGPISVKARVSHKEGLLERLHWEGPVVDLDVDMGAHIYWTDFWMMDIAGLVDVPFAQHRFDRGFVREYVFEERKPLFAHIHGGWAGTSKIPTHKEWRGGYIEVPGYSAGKAIHIGNHLRRDAIFDETWPIEPDRSVHFGRGTELAGWRAPAGIAAPDRRLFLEVALQIHLFERESFRILGFLANDDGELVVFDLPPAYDWVPQAQWRRTEIFHGRFSPKIPADLPPGTYDLGFVLLTEGGAPVPAEPEFDPERPFHRPLPPGAVLGGVGEWPARLAVGEVRYRDAIEIVDESVVLERSDAAVDDAHTAAAGDRCDEAIEAWALARAHRPKAISWRNEVGPGIRSAIAECWARKAEAVGVDQPDEAVALIARARDWDRHSPTAARVAEPVADLRYAEGMAARAEQDWQAAYDAFTDVLTVAPHRAWARRHAEQARIRRLGIRTGSKVAEKASEWEARQVREREDEASDAPEGGE